jgi:Outer membrane protein beta-barrel domain
MKTKTISLCMLSLILLFGSAKTLGQGFSLGAKAGVGLSYFSNFDDGGTDMTKRSTNIMFDGGLIGNLSFTKSVSLQFELLFEQKGEKYKITLLQEMKARLYLNYLTLPIMVEFSHQFGNFKLFGGLGPYIGYALDGKMIFGDQKESIKFGTGDGEYRRFDAGLSVNLGGGFKVGRGNIFLDLRYNYGFIDVQQLKDKPEGYKTHCNRNFGIYLGYLIPLGKS